MALFFVSRVAAALIALVTLLIFTRLLAPDDFGRYSIVILSAVIAQQLVFAWIVVSLTRFHSSPEFGGRAIALGLGAGAWTLALATPIAFLGYVACPESWREIYVLTAAFATAHALHEIALACLRVERRSPAFAAIAIGRPVLGTALAAAILLGGGSYRGVVAGMAVGALVTGGCGLVAIARRSGIDRPGRFALSTFFTFGQPLALVMSGSMVFGLTTQLILAWQASLDQVGFFAATSNVTDRSIAMLMMTLGQTMAASIFRAQEEGSLSRLAGELEAHFGFLLLVSTPLVLVFVFSNRTVAQVLFDADFGANVAAYLPFLAIAAFVNGLQSAFLAFIFSMRKQTLLQLALTAALLLVHVAIVLATVSVFGGIGAAYAAMATACLTAGLYAWFGRDVFGRCSLRAPLIQMITAAIVTVPFLLAADRAPTLPGSLALIGAGMVAMLAVLKIYRYSSLEAIVDTALRSRP